jgi:branched-subunit amino acid transport protein
LETTSLTLFIVVLALGTFSLRFLPLAVLSRVNLPGWAQEWLRLVPGAVLAASLAQVLFIREGQITLSWTNAYLLAAIPAFLVSWRTRSMGMTILSGMAAYVLFQNLLG